AHLPRPWTAAGRPAWPRGLPLPGAAIEPGAAAPGTGRPRQAAGNHGTSAAGCCPTTSRQLAGAGTGSRPACPDQGHYLAGSVRAAGRCTGWRPDCTGTGERRPGAACRRPDPCLRPAARPRPGRGARGPRGTDLLSVAGGRTGLGGGSVQGRRGPAPAAVVEGGVADRT